MTEGTTYTVGHLRIKYLDLANMAFAQNNYLAAKGYVDDFLDTIKEDTNSGKTIKKEFDTIHQDKKQKLQELDNSTKTLGFLEQKDVLDEGRAGIEVNAIHDMKEVCWRVALKEGLFND